MVIIRKACHRAALILLAVIAATAVLAPAASAGSRVQPGKPYTIQTLNGNHNCFALNGSSIVQHGPPGAYTCLNIFFDKIGMTSGGYWKGQLETGGSNNQSITVSSCNPPAPLRLGSVSAVGTTWILFNSTPVTQYLVNDLCQRSQQGDCSPVVSADDFVNHVFGMAPRGTRGAYQTLHIYTPPHLPDSSLPLSELITSPYSPQQAVWLSRHFHCCPCS